MYNQYHMQEIEVKFLDVDPVAIEKKLLSLGAERVYDTIFEEWIFQKPEWVGIHGRVRIRHENGKVHLAYKETIRKTSAGNTEIEFLVSDHEQALAFIHKMNIPLLRHQQKRRMHFLLDEVAIEIDFWPQIPPLMEIEANSKAAIATVAKKLGFSMKDACELDARQVIQEIYGVQIDALKEYVF